jgi:SAM-dependent methyltransferase
VRGDAAALPFANETFDLVLCSMALMLFEPVDAALAEVRRVLIPRGIALFLLPGSRPLSARDRVRYARVLAALRELGPAYPNQVHLGRLPSRLSRASLSVLGDDRRRFRYRFGDERAARRFVESLYAPGRPPERIERAVQLAEGWVGSEIDIPLRRLVCQKHLQSDQLPGHFDQLSD